MDEVRALHERAREGGAAVVVAVVERDVERPGEAAHGTDDGETVLVALPLADARGWLGEEATKKWASPAQDAMDVAVVGAGGRSVYRLSRV